ncbi:uncharacterized protein [Nicotiana tomentosiformis]|uniref:uncharacterized protein n=1 Tax=Nicotiana tomentosiformis TaxID=4098 RepID=UPI00388C679B
MTVGDSIIGDRVYRSCVVTINGFDIVVDLMLFDMVDFEVILGMEWLSLYHALLDYHAKTMTLSMLGLPRLEWRRTLGHSTSRVVSNLKAQHMVEKECLAYLSYIHDFSVEVPSMDSIRVLSEFPEVFPTYLASMQPGKDIDLFIYLVSGTQPIYIPPYHMAPTELKDLIDKLHDLLDKGFIRLSVSPRGAQMLFVKKKYGLMRMCIDYRKLN